MSDKPWKLNHGIVEIIGDKDGSTRIQHHGSECARTHEVRDALNEGKMPRHPDHPKAAKCGPAMVNSEAFRTNWETIFGKKQVVGQA